MAISTGVAILGAGLLGAGASIISGNQAADTQAAAGAEANNLAMQQFLINREDAAPWRNVGRGALERLRTGTARGGEFDRNAPAFKRFNDGVTRKFSLADFEADPGRDFRRSEGEKSINRSLLRKGKGLSGAGLKAGIRFNSDFASNEFDRARSRFNEDDSRAFSRFNSNQDREFDRFTEDQTTRFNRLAALSGTSQDTTERGAREGSRLAELMGENVIGAGNSAAAAQVNTGNAINNAINQGTSLYARFR